MPKSKSQIKTFTPPADRAHWFDVQFACSVLVTKPTPGGSQTAFEKRFVSLNQSEQLATMWSIKIFAFSARDAHYQLSIQMEALGWTEGQNWRVTMICPEAER